MPIISPPAVAFEPFDFDPCVRVAVRERTDTAGSGMAAVSCRHTHLFRLTAEFHTHFQERKLRISDKEFKFLRDFIHDQSGIYVEDFKKYLFESRLSPLAKKEGCPSFGAFYDKLVKASRFSRIFKDTINAMTTNETFWFRDARLYEVLGKHILPECTRRHDAANGPEVKIWSAACATGQEPYSIAMFLKDFFGEHRHSEASWEKTAIVATDISSKMITHAKIGWYDRLAMERGLTDDYLARYFHQEKGGWVIDDAIRKKVRFETFNLKDPVVGLSGPFDIVFLRNVAIYFPDDFKRDLFERIFRVMRPGGFLFLGNGETITVSSVRFEPQNKDGVLYYRCQNSGR